MSSWSASTKTTDNYFKDSNKFKYLDNGNIAYKTNKDTWANVLLDGITIESKIESENIQHNIITSYYHFNYYKKQKKQKETISYHNKCDNCQKNIVNAYIFNSGKKFLLCSKYCIEQIKLKGGCLICGTHPINDDYDNGFFNIQIENYESFKHLKMPVDNYPLHLCNTCHKISDICSYCNYFGGSFNCYMCGIYNDDDY